MDFSQKITIGLVDDHKLFREGLSGIIDSFENYKVVLEADNGNHLIAQLEKVPFPSIILLDINMPIMDGFETAEHLVKNFPQCRLLALSMSDSEISIIKMLKIGAKGYILKDIRKAELKDALDSIVKKGFYYSDLMTNTLISSIGKPQEEEDTKSQNLESKMLEGLNENLIKFLKLSCSELTYKEIADIMYLSVHTIDGYRNALFEKLNVKSRVGLVLYAIKAGLINM